jgi:hypothetical protein
VRDGHEPNEAEEQRPCCVPIEPVHVNSSPKDRREQEGYQNSGFVWWKRAAANSQIAIETWSRAPVSHGIDRWPRHLPAPSPPIPHFCDTLPDRENTGYPLGQRFNLCKRSRSSRPSLRTGTRQGLGAWIASTLFQTALFTANTLVLGDAIST